MTEITISTLLDVMPDAEAVDEHWRRLCREMVATEAAAEFERGLHDGYLLAVADFKAYQHGVVRDAQLEQRRWHLCCRRCRLEGHQDSCRDCENRTRESFGQASPGEPSPAEIPAQARASWEPLGLGPGPGWVQLGGQAVHHHRCTAACYACRPGWYTTEAAAAIIATLPGDYAQVVAELRVQARAAAPGKAVA